MPAPPSKSLARVLSKFGVASRTVAAQWIMAGRVSLNGQVERNPERRVNLPEDEIRVDGQVVTVPTRRYLMMNKPRGLVTTRQDEQGRPTVFDCLSPEQRGWLSPVGRLDKASEGLLLFTNDTRWGERILAPACHLPKTYHVQVEGQPDEGLLSAMLRGVPAHGGDVLSVDRVTVLRRGEKNAWLAVVLHEGKNRHIRRLLDALGMAVLRLVRVAIGPLVLGDLKKGATRDLAAQELQAIADALGATETDDHRPGVASGRRTRP